MRHQVLSLLRRPPALGAARVTPVWPTVRRHGPTKMLRTQFHKQGTTRLFSIDNLRGLVHKSLPSYFPPQLMWLINQAAEDERQSNLTDEMYDDVARKMLSFMLQMTNSPNEVSDEDRMTGEEVYSYNTGFLDLYDALVWGFNAPFLWRIAQEDVRSLYKSNISEHHCEVGVGTGLFLSKDVSHACKAITLIDLNENSLYSCKQRIRDTYLNRTERYGNKHAGMPDVSKVVADIMVPLEKEPSLAPLEGMFQSVGANFLFHCLHGSDLHKKEAAFRNCASLLDPRDGVFYGSTILGKEMLCDQMNAGESAMQVLHNFNESGVFGNLGDSMEDLECLLNKIFDHVEVWRTGYCGVWAARNPK